MTLDLDLENLYLSFCQVKKGKSWESLGETACKHRKLENLLENKQIQDREEVQADDSRNYPEHHAKRLDCIIQYMVENPTYFQRRVRLMAV